MFSRLFFIIMCALIPSLSGCQTVMCFRYEDTSNFDGGKMAVEYKIEKKWP